MPAITAQSSPQEDLVALQRLQALRRFEDTRTDDYERVQDALLRKYGSAEAFAKALQGEIAPAWPTATKPAGALPKPATLLETAPEASHMADALAAAAPLPDPAPGTVSSPKAIRSAVALPIPEAQPVSLSVPTSDGPAVPAGAPQIVADTGLMPAEILTPRRKGRPETLTLDDVRAELARKPASRDRLMLHEVRALLHTQQQPDGQPGAPANLDLLAQRQAGLDTGMGRLRSGAHAFVQGAGDVVASMPKSAAIALTGMREQLLADFDRIDRGGQPENLGTGSRGPVRAYIASDPARRQQIRAVVETWQPDPRELAPFQAGEALERAIAEQFPTNPAYRGEFLADTLPRAGGSTAGFLATGIASRLLGLPPVIGAATTGAGVQAAQQFEDALANGASIEDAATSARLGATVGLSEAIPIARMLDRFDKASGGSLRKVLVEGLKGGGEEMLQELTQQVASNLIASDLVKYDRDRGMFEGAGESGAAGFTIGALYSFLAGALGLKLGRTPNIEPRTPLSESQPPAESETGWASGEDSNRPDRAPESTAYSTADVGESTGAEVLSLDEVQAISAGSDQGTLSLDEATEAVRGPKQGGPGTRYTTFRRDDAGSGGRDISDPVRRETILKRFAEGMGVPIYEGRIKNRSKMLGFFRPSVSEVRTKRHNDLEVAAHEMAHLLDDRLPEIRAQWTPASNANKTVRNELRSVSYDERKLFEGFAEYVRLWMTQPDKAKSAAPTFTGWFEDNIAAHPQYGPVVGRARDEMLAWYEQDALKRAASKVGLETAVSETTRGLFDRVRQSVFDDLHGIARMEEEMSGGKEALGAYETARLTRAKFSVIEGAMLYGAPKVDSQGRHHFVRKGLKAILEPVADDLDRWGLYAIGRSAQELMAQGRENLFTRNEIKAMLALETPAFKKAFAEYQDWNSAVLDFAEHKGLISGAKRRMWKRAQYLPFWRVGQPGVQTKAGGVEGAWQGIKALRGGTQNLRNPIQNIIENAAMLIDAALTNEARLKVVKLAKQKGGARFLVQIPREEKTVKVARDEILRRIVEALGARHLRELSPAEQDIIRTIAENLDGLVALELRGQAPLGPNVIAAVQGGETFYFEVADPLVYRSIQALNRPYRGWVTRVLSVPKRIGQASITLSLDFMAANFTRDTMMASIMSRHGFKPMLDSLRGMKSRLLTDENYKGFIANGGGFSSYFVDDQRFSTYLERYYGRKGINYRTVLDTPKKFLFAAERLADSFEMAARLGEFRRAVRAGNHPRHAAFLAREVSTDFGMRGDSEVAGFLYDTIIFLKAGMNGLDRLYRGLVHDPNKRSIAAKSGALAMMSASLYAINRGNPLYDDLEDWDRDVHWHFFAPTPAYYEFVNQHEREPQTQAEAAPLFQHFRLPKIWEVGAMASVTERGLEGFLDGQPVEAARQSVEIIRDLMSFEYVPQAVAPLYDVAINRNRFTDRPIETQGMKELEPWARAGPGTSTSLRKLGEASRNVPVLKEVSPPQLEALLRGYLNTWALYGLTLADGVFFDDAPDMRVDQYPVVRRFYQQHPARITRHVSRLYELIEEATQVRRTMRHMDKSLRPDIADEMEHRAMNLAYGQLSRAQQHMRAVNREIRAVHDMRDVAEAQRFSAERERVTRNPKLIRRLRSRKEWNDLGALKRVLLDDLISERNEFAQQVVKEVEAGIETDRRAPKREPETAK